MSRGEASTTIAPHPEPSLVSASFATSERRYQRLFDSPVVGIFVGNAKGAVSEANNAFLEMVGYDREDLPLCMAQLTPPERYELDRAKMDEAREGGRVVPYETEYLSKDGRRVPVLTSGTPVQGSDSEYLCTVLDLTERRGIEQRLAAQHEQLKKLPAQVVLAEERERRRIARGLHDDIGHFLALLRGRLGALAASGGAAQATVDELRDLLDHAIAETRSLTFELSSPVLHELGLAAALESLGEQMARQGQFRCRFEAQGVLKTVAHDTAVVLYRAARELLMNVIKHSRARNVRISIKGTGNELRVEIGDDGKGFDAEGLTEGFSKTGTFGLFSIGQQVDHLGGRFVIESAPGKGTSVIIIVPLDEQQVADNQAGRLP